MSSTPNYIITTDYVFSTNLFDEKTIKAGSFVRPVDTCWLPYHILNATAHKWFDPKLETYVYSRYGIIIIPLKLIRKV